MKSRWVTALLLLATVMIIAHISCLYYLADKDILVQLLSAHSLSNTVLTALLFMGLRLLAIFVAPLLIVTAAFVYLRSIVLQHRAGQAEN